MSWIILVMAGLFEVAFAFCLGKAKETTGHEVYWWYIAFYICSSLSFILLIKAIQQIPVGTGYAVWTGVGVVGTVLVGIWAFKDPINFWKIVFIITLIGSIIGLKVVSH